MVKKKNSKAFFYEIPHYKFHVYFATSIKDFNKVIRKLKFKDDWLLDEDSKLIAGYCCYSQNGIFIIGVFNNSLNTLVHELSHFMIYLYEHIGSNINRETTEQFAYQMGDMTDIFYEKLKLANKKEEIKDIV